MLAGTKALIERTLGLSTTLQSKESARLLSVYTPEFDPAVLVRSLYSLLELNRDRSVTECEQLWRWAAMPQLAARNPSPEKKLERAIVTGSGEWVNHIPAAFNEPHLTVDLARRCGPNWFEFVELKTGPYADTPLWGAFEIVRYGLLYCLARAHRSRLYMPDASVLMKAWRVDLKMLATRDVYEGYELGWLEQALDGALKEFSRRMFFGAFTMTFRFEAFPREWSCLDDALARRSAIYARPQGSRLSVVSPLHRESA
jgi:hypothetical protein